MVGLFISLYIVSSYALSLPRICCTACAIALKLFNPGWVPRALTLIPTYCSLTVRATLRFWVKHGFRLMFVLITLSYLWSTMSVANRDDPFTVIGASSSSTPREIRKLCRKQSLQYHPDKHPGREEEVRPSFERVARACKTLNDPKKRAQFERFGIVESEEVQGGSGSSATAHLGWFTTTLFWFWVSVGVPVTVVYNYSYKLKSGQDCVALWIETAKTLHSNMLQLYTYGHYG